MAIVRDSTRYKIFLTMRLETLVIGTFRSRPIIGQILSWSYGFDPVNTGFLASDFEFVPFLFIFDGFRSFGRLNVSRQSIPTTNIDLLFDSFATMSFNWLPIYYIQGFDIYVLDLCHISYVQWYPSQTVSDWLVHYGDVSKCHMESISLRSTYS